jgi:hypothetical protein
MASPITPLDVERVAVAAAMNPYSTLDAAGNRMWERSYNKNLAAGEGKQGAAIHAWMHVRKYYRKDPRTGMWVSKGKTKRGKKRASKKRTSKKRARNPVTLRSVMSKALR